MDLESLTIYARVAELASFTQAADQLGLPKARVSTAVQALESQLGTRLLHRTTRSVRMTPDGEAFYERCKAVIADIDELGSLFQQAPTALRGRLRIDMPTAMAREIVIPRLGEFMAAHPLIDLELSSTDRRVDLVHEGFDCVVRVGTLADSELIARPLGHYRMVNCASPAYLAAHGTPTSLNDLDAHWLVHYSSTLGTGSPGWEYVDGGGRVRFKPMRGRLTVNNAHAYKAACVAGLGLIQAPQIAPLLGDGQLIEVLPQFRAAPMPVSLLYAHRAGLSKRLRALMDWIALVLAPHLAAVDRSDQAS
jgi:DNA-binding transcriptional LysR family regulator